MLRPICYAYAIFVLGNCVKFYRQTDTLAEFYERFI